MVVQNRPDNSRTISISMVGFLDSTMLSDAIISFTCALSPLMLSIVMDIVPCLGTILLVCCTKLDILFILPALCIIL